MKFLFVLFNFLFFTITVFAQNCTVNAGIDQTVCAGTPIIQEGNVGGSIIPNSVVWSQVSGPNTATLFNAGSLSVNISNLIAGTYVFIISATCQVGGVVSDQCTITATSGATIINPTSLNLTCYIPGTAINLTGTAPINHSLSWSLNNNSAPMAANFNGTGLAECTGNNPTIQFAAPNLSWCAGAFPQNASIRIRSTNNLSGCYKDTTFSINYNVQASSITGFADPSIICGTTTKLIGSCPFASTGTWTVVSTPVSAPTPIFLPNANSSTAIISNLVAGNYVVQWTVAGSGCTNGSSNVVFTVNSTTSPFITTPIANSKFFCDNNIPTIVSLEGSLPASGETVSWSQVSGGSTTITNATSPFAQATGLTSGGGPYIYQYLISKGGCFKKDTMVINNSSTNIAKPVDLTLCFAPTGSLGASSRVGVIPFMYSDSVKYSITYLNGPIPVISGNMTAQLMNPNGSIAVSSISPSTIANISLGNTHNKTFYGNILWPTFSNTVANISFNMSMPLGSSCTRLIPGIYRYRVDVTTPCGTISNECTYNLLPRVIMNAGTDQSLPCGQMSTSLAGSIPNCSVDKIWSTIQMPSSATNPINVSNESNANASITGLIPGTYLFKWGARNLHGSTIGCIPSKEDTVRVVVANFAPPVPAVSASTTVCVNYPTTIVGEIPATASNGVWTVTTVPIGGTYTITPSVNSSVITFTPTTNNTVYTLTWTVSNNCGTAVNNTTVTTSATSAVVPNISNVTNCNSFYTTFGTLSATPAGGVWSSNNPYYTLSTPNSSTTNVTPSAAYTNYNTVTFYYTTNSGCGTLKDSVSYVNDLAPFYGRDTFCFVNSYPTSQSTTFSNLQMYATYEFVSILGPGNASVSPTVFTPTTQVQNIQLNVSAPGTYTVGFRKRQGECYGSVFYKTYYFSTQPPLAIAGSDIDLCGSSNSVTLNAQPNPIGAFNGIWNIQSIYNGFTPTITNAATPSPTLTFNNGGGDVLLRWLIQGQNTACAGGSQDFVRVRYVPRANAGTNIITCYDAVASPASVVLSGNFFTSGVGTWTIVSQPVGSNPIFINPNLPATSLTNLTNGFYTLRWTIVDPTGTCPTTFDEVDVMVYYVCLLLPLKIKYFTANHVEANQVNLNWKIENESPDFIYYVERSTSNNDFQQIGEIVYNQNSNSIYNFLDKTVGNVHNRLYYRIKAVEKNTSKIFYSHIISIENNLKKIYVQLESKTTKKGMPIVLNNFNETDGFNVQIYSVSGQLIYKKEYLTPKRVFIETNNMTNGMYILNIYSKGNLQTYKIMVN